jgi:DNA-binding HxlR family transcriptional regulator
MKLSLSPAQTGIGYDKNCPMRDVLDCIGDRWSLLVLAYLSAGTLRFTELKRAIGDISQRMLSQTLRSLERDGYLSRHAYPTVPPKVEYTLTALGTSLLQRVEPLLLWANENHAKVLKAREAYVPPPAAAPL